MRREDDLDRDLVDERQSEREDARERRFEAMSALWLGCLELARLSLNRRLQYAN